MQILSFVFFTGLVGAITFCLTRRDKHDSSDSYFLAGRSLTGGFIAGSLMLTNLSTEQLVGLNGGAFKNGLSVMCWEVIAGCSLVLMGLFFLPRYLKAGIATVPEFLEKRYDKLTRSITSLIFIVAYTGILLPIVLYTGATGLDGILDVQELTGIESRSARIWLIVWMSGVIGSLYAIFGGLRTVAVSDTINGFGLLVGGILITWFGLSAIDANPFSAISTMKEAHPEKFNSIGGPKSDVPFSTLFTGVLLLNLFYWCTNQQIIQRTFGATSLREGQKGVLIAGCLKVLAPIILVLPGIIAFYLHSNGKINVESQDLAYGTLVQSVLPTWLAGFFGAVLVGAILSSFNSALNSTATLFSLGVYRGMIKREATDQQVIGVGKIFGAVIALISMTAAPFLLNVKGGIFEHLQFMNGLYFIPIFAVVVVGFAAKRVPPIAASVALVVGFTVMCLGHFVWKDETTGLTLGMHGYHFLGAVFVSLIAIMLVIGAIKPKEKAWENVHSGDVDLTPWGLAKPVGAGIVIFVLVLYASLADFSVLKKEEKPSEPTKSEAPAEPK